MVRKEGFLGCFIITFLMKLVDSRCIYSHRTVHVDWNLRNLFLVYKKVEVINQFLCAFNCKCRNDDFTLCVYCSADDFFKFLKGAFGFMMKSVSIGAFEENVVWGRHVC